jgi:hypothetical protein
MSRSRTSSWRRFRRIVFVIRGHARQKSERRILLAGKRGSAVDAKAERDDDLTLVTDFGKTEAICIDVLDNAATEEGVLLKVMSRGPFETRSASLDR